MAILVRLGDVSMEILSVFQPFCLSGFVHILLTADLRNYAIATLLAEACALAVSRFVGHSRLLCLAAFAYTSIVKALRLHNRYHFRQRYGWRSDEQSYRYMSVPQAQEVYRQLAQWDFPFLFEFGWIVEIFKVFLNNFFLGSGRRVFDTSISGYWSLG